MLNAQLFTWIVAFFLLSSAACRIWLVTRQLRHVMQHRGQVPTAFQAQISLADHQKAADYTRAKLRLILIELPIEVGLLLGLTWFGGLESLNQWLIGQLGPGMLSALGLFVVITVLAGCVSLPLQWYRQFHLEQAFGFNRMTPMLFVRDLGVSSLLTACLGLPLLWLLLTLMQRLDQDWWWAAWLTLSLFQFSLLLIYPRWIAPLFNRFTPLSDADLKARIEALLARCQFNHQEILVMDGSKRSSHGNAYFTGFGRHKRIVFFDTLLNRLAPGEIEAVLAHELGHYKKRHLHKGLIVSLSLSLLLFYVLGWCLNQSWFYTGLGVTPPLLMEETTALNRYALALILFFLVLPVFTFFFSPIFSVLSRRHEFEADAFACQQARGEDLISALLKLYQDNAATLTPDPLYSAVVDSHPPAPVRIAHIQTQLRS
ncbi:M48 family metallopeptidase [Parvibium lacunae]|uniref:M48 family peptidase n=1 Tax=Parvibium lacunae TaxID=1888893 RepID=A0A368L4J7_9BURK|nr:M48 family metallopeptidase [Parvibium lacunae]RCS58403.1 M48 family peptidase [Parvibium lacunae]